MRLLDRQDRCSPSPSSMAAARAINEVRQRRSNSGCIHASITTPLHCLTTVVPLAGCAQVNRAVRRRASRQPPCRTTPPPRRPPLPVTAHHCPSPITTPPVTAPPVTSPPVTSPPVNSSPDTALPAIAPCPPTRRPPLRSSLRHSHLASPRHPLHHRLRHHRATPPPATSPHHTTTTHQHHRTGHASHCTTASSPTTPGQLHSV